MGVPVPVGDVQLWVEQQGSGPDVLLLLLSGLGDPLEAWWNQLEGLAGSFRVTAFDGREVGRSSSPDRPVSVADLAADAAGLFPALGITDAHLVGHSGGSLVAQELAVRHPELVRSLVLVGTWSRQDAYSHIRARSWSWMAGAAPSERDFLEAFYPWFYTRRAHEQGRMSAVIYEELAFPHRQSPASIERYIDAFMAYDSTGRLGGVSAPALVLTVVGDIAAPPDQAGRWPRRSRVRCSRCWTDRRTSPTRRRPRTSMSGW